MDLDTLQTIVLIVYISLTMLLMGFRLTWSHVRLLSDHRNLIGRTLLVNVVIVPAVAIILVQLFDLQRSFETGLFLVAVAPGAPFAPKLAERVKGPFPVAVALMFVLVIVSLFTIPVTVTIILLLEHEAKIVFPALFFMLIVVQTIPLLLGVAINSRWTGIVHNKLEKPLTMAANILLLAVVILIIVTNWGKLSVADGQTVSAVVLLLLSTLFFGWLLGGPDLLTRRVVAITSSARNVAVALLVAATTFSAASADVMIMLFAIVMMAADILLVAYWRKGTDVE